MPDPAAAPSTTPSSARYRHLAFLALALGIWLEAAAPAIAGYGRWTPLGPGGGAFVVAAGPSSPDRIYAVSNFTIYRSDDAGATWHLTAALAAVIGSSPVVDPVDADTLYLSSAGSELFKSTDAGVTWKTLPLDAQRALVAIAPAAPQTLLATSIESGVHLSTDGGASWTTLDLPTYALYGGAAFDPVNPRTAYLISGGDILGTLDGGTTWNRLLSLPNEATDLRVDPRNANSLYFVEQPNPFHPPTGPILWHSADRGATWSQAGPSLPTNVYTYCLAPSGAVYASVGESLDSALYQSLDSGATWQRISAITTGGGAGGAVFSLIATGASPDRLVAALGEAGVVMSPDQGRSWIAPAVQPSGMAISQVLIGPTAGSLYANGGFSAGGEEIFSDVLLHSIDGGTTWSRLSQPGVRDPRFVIDRRPGLIYAVGRVDGQADAVTFDDGVSWQPMPLPGAIWGVLDDLPGLVADPLKPERLLKVTGQETACGDAQHCFQYTVYRSNTAGQTWRPVAVAQTVSPWTAVLGATLWLEPHRPDTFYLIADQRLFRATVQLPVLGSVTALTTPGIPEALVVDSVHPFNLYALVAGLPPVIKSNDRGATWQVASTGLPPAAFIASYPYRLYDPVTLVIDPTTPTTLYVASVGGVFVSDDGAASWRPLNDGLPALTITSLAISPRRPRTIYAGTEGAGIYVLSRD